MFERECVREREIGCVCVRECVGQRESEPVGACSRKTPSATRPTLGLLSDFSKVDVLGVRYKSVNFRAETALAAPNRRGQIDWDWARERKARRPGERASYQNRS